MTGKKILFSKKPNSLEANQLIDNWVMGEGKEPEKEQLKRTTIYLPVGIHKKLKLEAANRDTSMTEIIIESIEKNLKNKID
ncbi:MAG: hypothetical protein HRU35_08320 [Rickettsiaceae bacterium]|nr:hypothetical protein [Rickettsiaceae bacterium]